MLGGLPLFSMSTGSVAPTLTSLDYDLADTQGGASIVATGTNLSGATITVGGTSAFVTGTTSTTATFLMPAKTAGSHNVQAITLSGGSNTLPIEAWNPTTDAACTLLFDCVHTAYNSGTGIWSPRYSAVANGNLKNNTSGSGNHSASGGAPIFDGDGTTEAGLVGETAGVNWDDYLGTASGGGTPGSIAAVYSSTNSDAISTVAPYTSPTIVGNVDNSSGTFGIGSGQDTGVDSAFAYILTSGVYKTLTAAASSGDRHAITARWANASDTFDLSVDGALSGAGYDSEAITAGTTAIYTSFPIYAGAHYNAVAPSYQTFAGTILAFAVLNDKASDAFIDKFYRWAKSRHGVA